MSSVFQQGAAYEYVVLVDRTGKGGCEIIHDGYRIVFKPGQKERAVPCFLAEWLFRVDQHKVHTTTGEYVQRFGIKDAPEEILRTIGEQTCEPITIDTNRAEGWDVDQYAERDARHTAVVTLRPRPGDYANDATPSTSFGNER